MTPDYDQLAEILAAAEELNGEARERYLNERCPPAWRAEVDSLLHAGDRGRDTFEQKASALGEILTAFRGEQLTGQTVGPYLLEALLGTGGMGVVYRGCHRQTGQIAAVKILAAQAGDSAWQARFDRETRTLQSIRHENVVRLLDAGEDDVYRYLAMEFVPGQSLREGCPRHWRDAAAIGRQLAAALQTIHAAGVVHRDLKPENVMLTEDGRAVLIDFGLARKDEKLNASVNSISGTFGYFSPEQVRGEPATGRSDVFALGALLYEMATGKRAFHGSSPLATAAAILSGKLPPLPGHLPVELATLIRRCLQQHVDRRPAAAEVETQLARLAAATKPPTLARRRWTRGALATAAVAAAAFAGWAVWLNTPPAPLFRQPIPTPGLQVFEPALAWHGDWLAFTAPGEGAALQAWITPARRWQPQQVTSDPEGVSEPALSPDGSRLAFRAARHPAGIYVRDRATNRERLLVPGGRSPRFSPDGRWIAYWTGRPDAVDVIRTGPSQAFVIAAKGGTPEPVAPHLDDLHHPIWAPDSQQLAFSRAGSLYTWDRRTRQVQPRHSRSERPIAWRSTFGRDEVLSLTGGQIQSLVLAAGTEARLTAPGEKGITATLDRSGRILLADETAVEGLWNLALHQPGATPTPILRGGGHYQEPRLSPDGRHLSYSVGNPPQPELRDLVSGRVITGRHDSLFTPTGRAIKVPTTQGVVWDLSPDGNVVLHACRPPNQNRSICLLRNGQDTLLLHHPRLHLYLACFSPDRSHIVFTGEADHLPPQIFLAPSAGAPSSQWQVLGPGDYPRFLPDGSLAFLHKTPKGHPALFQMAIGRPPVLLYEFTQSSPSPRLLTPGLFRLAAARHRLVFPLGEREGRLYEAEQISSAHVIPFPPISPVNGTGVSLLSKINLLSRSALFSVFALFGAAGSVPGAIVYTATGPASWGASDATIGVAGLSIYGFETTQLPTGVAIRFTRGDNNAVAYDTGFGGTLPFVFDISQDAAGTAFRLASAGDTNNATAHAWDGTRSLVNVPTQPITSYLPSFGWGTIRITFQTPVSTVGFSLQQLDRGNTLNIMTNGGLVTTDTTTAGLTQDGFRNGYLRIDGTAGTTINCVELVNVSGDGFAIDHLAFSAQSSGAVPEPGSALLMLAPLAGGWLWHRRRQRS